MYENNKSLIERRQRVDKPLPKPKETVNKRTDKENKKRNTEHFECSPAAKIKKVSREVGYVKRWSQIRKRGVTPPFTSTEGDEGQ